MKTTSPSLTGIQYQAVQCSQLFHGLADDELHAVLAYWHLKKYNEPAMVLLEGQTGDSVFLIVEGRAKIYCTDGQGREMVIGYKGAGEMLGEMGFIDGSPRSATVETVTPCTLLWTNREAFLQCCKMAPCMYENLLKIITTQLRLTNARMQTLLASGASCRVARLLIYLAQEQISENSGSLPFTLSQADIGAMTGLTRVSVNSVLSKWKRHNIISIEEHHRINIHDVSALKQEAR
jgi:CRP/FNR family cyclic AMP-dependent transcriptional regulator